MNDYMKQLELIQINQQITECKFILEEMHIKGYRQECYEDILEDVRLLESKKEEKEKKAPFLQRLAQKINDDAVASVLAKKDKALAVNPVGLKVNIHSGTFKEPLAINKKFAKEVKPLLAKYEKDKDLQSFKSEYKRVYGNYRSSKVGILEQKENNLTELKNISKQDIKDAIAFLENIKPASNKINTACKNAFDGNVKFIEKYDNSYVKGAARMCYFADNVSYTNYDIFKFNNKMKDSVNIIKLASVYNPRKLKESAEIVELEEAVMFDEFLFEDIE